MLKRGLRCLDEVVLKGQGLMLIGDEDVFDVDRFAHKRAGLGVRLGGRKQIGADP